MTRKIRGVLLQTVFLFIYAQSQQVDFSNHFEFGGGLTYKSSSISESQITNQETVPPIISDKLFKLFPSIGYYFTPNIEVVIEPRYTYRFQKVYSDFLFYGKDYKTYTLYQPGISLGLYYQFLYIDKIIPFIGLRVGWNWSKSEIDYGGYIIHPMQQGWSKPEVSFPSYAGGIKLFVSEGWAIIIQAQYSEVNNWSGVNGLNDQDVDYILGFSVLL